MTIPRVHENCETSKFEFELLDDCTNCELGVGKVCEVIVENDNSPGIVSLGDGKLNLNQSDRVSRVPVFRKGNLKGGLVVGYTFMWKVR